MKGAEDVAELKRLLLEMEPSSAMLSAIPSPILSPILSAVAAAKAEALATAEACSAKADLSRRSPKGDDG
jgi:hypothetical protein